MNKGIHASATLAIVVVVLGAKLEDVLEKLMLSSSIALRVTESKDLSEVVDDVAQVFRLVAEKMDEIGPVLTRTG